MSGRTDSPKPHTKLDRSKLRSSAAQSARIQVLTSRAGAAFLSHPTSFIRIFEIIALTQPTAHFSGTSEETCRVKEGLTLGFRLCISFLVAAPLLDLPVLIYA